MKYNDSLRLTGIVMFTGIMLFVFASSGAGAGQKDMLVIGMQDDTVSLDPARTAEKDAMAIINQVYEKLVTFGDDLSNPLPAIADSWEIEPDGKTWIFHLRSDTVFASGNPINADAVVYSLRRAVALQGNSAWLLTQFGLTEATITKVDDHTVQMVLAQKYAPGIFLACLASSIGSIIDQHVVMSHEANQDQGGAWLDTHAAGSGRFLVHERTDEQTILAANPQYRGAPPAVATVVIKRVPEPLEQAIMLRRGELDVAWNLQPKQIQQLETNPDLQIFTTPTAITYYLAVSLTHPPFRQAEVRQALRYALNYDGLVDYVLEGVATKTQSLIPPGILGYQAVLPYPYAPAKATQLFAKAGYPDGFEMELACLNYAPWTGMASQIKRDFRKLGIRVNIVEKNAADLLATVKSREFQAYLWEWELNYPDPDAIIKSFAHADQEGAEATVKLAAWETHYVNPSMAALTEQAAQEIDPQKREALYQQINTLLLDDGPFIVLASPKKQYAIRLEVDDLIGMPSFLSSGLPTIRETQP